MKLADRLELLDRGTRLGAHSRFHNCLSVSVWMQFFTCKFDTRLDIFRNSEFTLRYKGGLKFLGIDLNPKAAACSKSATKSAARLIVSLYFHRFLLRTCQRSA
jgi:hypothetical protein